MDLLDIERINYTIYVSICQIFSSYGRVAKRRQKNSSRRLSSSGGGGWNRTNYQVVMSRLL